MEYWHEIVKSYDYPKSKDPKKKKNDGTYFQSSVVILLIYLTFGSDHPFSIAKFFHNLPIKQDEETPYRGVLKNSKVGTLLNKMKEDQLVTVAEQVVKGKPTKTYSINPRVIQSPIREGTYIKRDGSILEIPLDLVEQLLAWKNWKYEESKRVCDRDEFFKIVDFTDTINYFRFMEFLDAKASYRECEIQNNWELRKPSSLEKLLRDYYDEIRDHCGGMFFLAGSRLNLWRDLEY